jgi:hypothetical protein
MCVTGVARNIGLAIDIYKFFIMMNISVEVNSDQTMSKSFLTNNFLNLQIWFWLFRLFSPKNSMWLKFN